MKKIKGQSEEVHKASLLLGNTVRLGILNLLAEGPTTRAEIAERLDLVESGLAQQMNLLTDMGVTTPEVMPGRGRPVLYTLNRPMLEEYEAALRRYLLRE